jgi:hypothetical protein
MIDNQLDTPNTTLTNEETVLLTEAQRRLHVLENEIAIATKNLQVTKKDSEKAYKDKIYQDEQLLVATDVLSKVLSRINEANDVEQQMADSLKLQQVKSAEDFAQVKEAKDELRTQQEIFDIKQKEHNIKVENFTKEYSEFLKEKDEVMKAKDILSKAIASLPW